MQAAAPAGRQGSRGQGGGRGQAAAAGGRGQAPAQQFQSLELLADQAGLARTDDNGGNANDSAAQLLLPAGFSPDTSTESVTSIGSSQANAGFFGPNGPGDFADRFGNGLGGGDSALVGAAGQTGPAGRGGPGGPGGFAGGRGGFGGPFGGRGGRGNQIRGSVYQSMDSSVLDTAPFALNGQPTIKPDYFQQRLGATLGGPLVDSARRQQPANVLLRQLHRQSFAQSRTTRIRPCRRWPSAAAICPRLRQPSSIR